jgi:serine/threonine protein phosphatase 1
MQLGEARAPNGIRLYAIGDVHGCDGLLEQLHRRIEADLATQPAADYRLIHLGDYVDRGPDSKAVLERLQRLRESDGRVICLKGNHEEMLLRFLADPSDCGPVFIVNGGDATLASYGVAEASRSLSPRQLVELSDRLAMFMPARHRAFLESLDMSARFGDFFFCHAGVRPGVPIERQKSEDLIWIREPFLESKADFGAVVVHGHTPAPKPDIRPNRINIDTGAVFTGMLTCVAIEGSEFRFL